MECVTRYFTLQITTKPNLACSLPEPTFFPPLQSAACLCAVLLVWRGIARAVYFVAAIEVNTVKVLLRFLIVIFSFLQFLSFFLPDTTLWGFLNLAAWPYMGCCIRPNCGLLNYKNKDAVRVTPALDSVEHTIDCWCIHSDLVCAGCEPKREICLRSLHVFDIPIDRVRIPRAVFSVDGPLVEHPVGKGLGMFVLQSGLTLIFFFSLSPPHFPRLLPTPSSLFCLTCARGRFAQSIQPRT